MQRKHFSEKRISLLPYVPFIKEQNKSIMNEKVLKTLEYTKIIDRLTDHASSDPGRRLCRALTPLTDLSEIRNAQRETGDALSRLFAKGGISFGSNCDLGMSLRSLEIGSTLSAAELLHIAGLLENAARVRTYGKKEREDSPEDSLSPLFEAIEPLAHLSREILRCIISEEEISDDASPGLKHVRRSMVNTTERIHSQLAGMVNGSLHNYLQDALVTSRNGRYCIPVKAEYRSQVPGMVHDQSSTGSTLFIEPASVVNLNNQMRELEIQEQQEIAKVLATLSVQVEEHAGDIAENQRILTHLDFVFAKAALAMEQNATEPLFNEEHIIHIRGARHPLLDKKKTVPIDIRLGRDYDLLIVTGPNTGGKTVSLKTTGLFCLMGQSGLHIPALDRSELPVFREVYADIGDEQSIEQSLSTFSSHMTSIVSILAHADADSLCLFDELGAGTDPTEGAALAIAILNHLHDRGIRTMATTHYSELKVYALSTSFVENACCEFDVESLRPTYRLLIGIPGKSNAFAISRRLGLSDEIIEAASAQIGTQDKNFEDLLSDLEKSRITIEKEQNEIAAYRREVENLKKQLEAKQEKIDQTRDRILREANEQARSILQEAKDTADETIRVFQKAGPGASMKDLERQREMLRNKISDKNEKLAVKNNKPASAGLKPSQLKPGESVRIISMGLKGTVSSMPDHKGNLFVQCGIIRTQTNIRDLELIPDKDSSPARQKGSGSGKIRMSKSLSISPEINLLGKTVDEAMPVLDKYLDDAWLAHLTSVRVVHGKGTGALRNAVQNHLRRVKYVKSWRPGEYGEGDAGVTIVEFKS